MSDETTLLPCICGGKASLKVLEYGDGCKVWGVFCESDLASEYSHGHFIDNYATKAEAIAVWNTRATHGTLTAEQVEIAINNHCRFTVGCVVDAQAIADELNARAERTCENISAVPLKFECSECDGTWSRPYGYEFNFCPTCGARVKVVKE